jgi:hypothetical protein
MLVMTLARTRAVLGGASRQATGVPTVEEMVGPGFLARTQDEEVSLLVPAADLEVKEVDYSDEAFRNPLAHVVDGSGTLVAASNRVSAVAATSVKVTVTLAPAPTAADKDVVVIIDAGPGRDALKFVGKTVATVATVEVPISGVPPGERMVLASADGYNSRLEVFTF